MKKTETTSDWGKVGQMQVDSTALTLTICVEEHEDYSKWRNYYFDTLEELEEYVSRAEKRGNHLVG